MNKSLKLFLYLILLSCFLLSCSVLSSDYLRESLSNRGIQRLSESNPYIASNMLLANEIEKSPLLSGFIEHRGTPDALEVREEILSPFALILYYLEDNEMYSLEESGAGSNWVIQGPSEIPESIASKLSNQSEKSETQSQHFKAALLSKPNAQEEVESEVILPETPEVISTPEEKKQRPKQAKKEIKKKPSADFSGEDITYTVTSENDSLARITEHFTGSASNVGRISRINSINPKTALKPGDKIRIPGYLLVTKDEN